MEYGDLVPDYLNYGRISTLGEEFVKYQIQLAIMESVALDRIRRPWSSTFEDSILTSPLLPIAAFVMSFLLFLWVVL